MTKTPLAIVVFVTAVGCESRGTIGRTLEDPGTGGQAGGLAGGGGPMDAPPMGGAGGGGSSGSGGGGIAANPWEGPITDCRYAATFVPPYTTAAELCAYVNLSRRSYAQHDPHKGYPFGGGEDHMNRTWPLEMEIDSALMTEAQAEADRLAAGGMPAGMPARASSLARYIYVDGLNTAKYTVSGFEELCEHEPGVGGLTPPAMDTRNGAARQAIYYYDPGGDGPVLTRIGCGGASMPGAGDRPMWWVVRFGP